MSIELHSRNYHDVLYGSFKISLSNPFCFNNCCTWEPLQSLFNDVAIVEGINVHLQYLFIHSVVCYLSPTSKIPFDVECTLRAVQLRWK